MLEYGEKAKIVKRWIGINQALREGEWAREGASELEELTSMWLVCRLEQKVDVTADECQAKMTRESEEREWINIGSHLGLSPAVCTNSVDAVVLLRAIHVIVIVCSLQCFFLSPCL